MQSIKKEFGGLSDKEKGELKDAGFPMPARVQNSKVAGLMAGGFGGDDGDGDDDTKKSSSSNSTDIMSILGSKSRKLDSSGTSATTTSDSSALSLGQLLKQFAQKYGQQGSNYSAASLLGDSGIAA